MADVNHVILIGRLTRDAELKYTAGGQAVCKFALAVNRRRKDGDQWVEEADFFDVVAWGRTGEALNQYLLKGKQIAVEGELRQDRWEQDGQNRSKVGVMATNIQLLGGGPQSGANGPGEGNHAYGERSPAAPATRRQTNGKKPTETRTMPPGEDGFADDIPF